MTEVYGQTLKVVDQTTLKPIKSVYIFTASGSKTTTTNSRGEADIQKFSLEDTLNFQHPAYKRLTLPYSVLQNTGFNAQLIQRSIVMEEIFVSANRREQVHSEISHKVVQIGEEEILFDNPQTAADLLENSGKVYVQKSQLGGGSPMIRGFAANSVLLAIDGIRMNNAIFRSGNLQNVISLDANTIENTEVLYGPGSIMYGSDALGGVMNFQTKKPELSFSDQKIYTYNALARYSSANNEQTIHTDASIGLNKLGFRTSVSYSRFDDLRSGGNFYNKYPEFGRREQYVIREKGTDQIVNNSDVTIQKFSGYDQLNLMQKIRYSPSNQLDVNYGFHFATTTDIPRYDRLTERENGNSGPFVNAEWHYGPQIWMMNALDVDYMSELVFFDKVSGIFSYQWFQESRNDRRFGGSELRNREENVDALTANIDFDKDLADDKKLYYGLESIYNDVHSTAKTTDIETGRHQAGATRYPDGGSRYHQNAVYTKYQQNFSSVFTASAGIRYSHIRLNARFNSTEFYDFPFDKINLSTGALNGSLGFIWRPQNDLQFNLKGSTGYRAPNVDDAAKVFDSEPGTVVVPNPDLKPEYAYNIDAAVIKRFRDFLRFETNLFYTWLDNAMVRRDFRFNGQDSLRYDGQLSNVEAVVNAGKAHVYGASLALSVEFNPHIGFHSSVTYNRGRDKTNDEPLRHVVPLFGRVDFTYQAQAIKMQLYSLFNGSKDISDFAPSEIDKKHLYTPDGSPGWMTFNYKISYRINESVQITGAIENIFDKHYRTYSSGISAPGRNVMIALRTSL